jgi:hypothetical protein
MKRAALVLVAMFALAPAAAAQRFVVGAQAAVGSYQEQGPSLDFTGWGPSVTADGSWRRFGLALALSRISYSPTDAAAAAEGFDLTQFDGRVRYEINDTWSVQAGYQQRNVAPSTAAQGLSFVPIGGTVAFALAPGARISANADYLAAAKFSGGGSAPFAMELGLHAYYAPKAGSVRFTVDFAFDRIDRTTNTGSGTVDSPIQSATTTLGVAFAF